MSKSLKAALTGLAVAVGLSLGLNILFASLGAGSPGSSSWVLPMVIGTAVWRVMSRLSTNRAERTVAAGDRDAALSLTPPPDGALLVIVREGFNGKAVGLDVAVDGRTAVQLRSPRAAVLRVAPGEHEVVASNPQGVGKGSSQSLRVGVAAGEVAFVELRFAMGLADGVVKLERAADPARVRAALAKLTVVAPEPEWNAAA